MSATGTLAINGVHIHLAVADGNGHVTGGHLMEGSTVNTTVELCVLESDQIFKREFDPDTGFYELVILDEE